MEYRKLISFGKSSFVVSLPKPWVVKQNLKKGDLIYFDDRGVDLVLHPRENTSKDEVKEVTIEIDGKDMRRIQREIISHYIKNYKNIILIGRELKDKAQEIESAIQNLIALEIMEQTSNRIMARDFLNMEDISLINLIRKMDIITRAMLEDALKTFEEDCYDNLMHRDKDINRLCFLVFRVVRYGLENTSFMYKKYNLNSIDLLNIWRLAAHIEAIADETKRLSRYMLKVKLDKKSKDKVTNLLKKIKESYLETMKGYYTKNIELVHEILQQKDTLVKECDKVYAENASVAWFGYLTNDLKALMTYVHDIARIVYQD
ncbi:MAG: phosphate uptake regulator PhoU [Candidatus Woesearchaeota archaeon]